jgi:dihydropyrimidinase
LGTVIRGGVVVTATDTQRADVLIEGERITMLAESIPSSGHTTIDATGTFVFPGGVDPHTHLDMPFGGTITADDFESGTRAALLGGTTTVVDFALHTRGDSLHNALKTWHAKAGGKACGDYAFHLTIADGRDETMNEIPIIIN